MMALNEPACCTNQHHERFARVKLLTFQFVNYEYVIATSTITRILQKLVRDCPTAKQII